MPKRKKSNLSYRTANAKKLRLLGESQTDERERRLQAERFEQSTSKASKSSSKREESLNRDRERHFRSRQNESCESREKRLQDDRDRHAITRSLQSDESRKQRLQDNRNRQAISRSLESEESREQRLQDDRERHTVYRNLESDASRERRLLNDRIRHESVRSSESKIKHEARLEKQREIYIECQEEIRTNLKEHRDDMEIRRHSESASEKNERLRLDKETTAAIRNIETEQRKQSGLTADVQRRKRQIFGWSVKLNSGFNYDIDINYSKESDIGVMSTVCNFCKALKWKGETKGLCCAAGKVHLQPILEPPEPLKSLLNGDHRLSKHFLNNIRPFNSAFQMTSFGAKEVHEGRYKPTFKIQGQVYHSIGSLLPVENAKEVFLQLYFISDYVLQRDSRLAIFPNLNASLVDGLQAMLNETNPYIQDFKTALQTFPSDSSENNYKIVINADKRPPSEHKGRHNEPTTNEVSVVLVDQQCDKRDIVLKRRDNTLQRISETHRSYDALQYPLIFCRGEDGYNFVVCQVDPKTHRENLNKKVSSLQYYCYRLMVRKDSYNHVHLYRQLFNQYIVDMYAKIETERLVFIRNNQAKLRVESYIHLKDAIGKNESTDNLGKLIILPSSFTGGPRYMHEKTQDAFVYVRKYGRPDLFITFTTNPKWNEIKRELFSGQTAADRHDIVSRVFKQKLKLLMNLLIKSKLFGSVLCYMYSIEWQKRGLPHVHILLWLENKIQPNQIDDVIRAELPNEEEDPELFEIIKTHMVHGPCGAFNRHSPCMKDGRCNKNFPKQFSKETTTGRDSYPLYRRREPKDGGTKTLIGSHNRSFEIDNRWIVPYSPVLSRTFQAHINVELCSSVKSIKYICKYVNKGSDLSIFGIENQNDEVTSYLSGRYISTAEAVWRMLSYTIHERFPPVTHLDVHLENGQRIYFNPDNIEERLENPKNTTLMAFFLLCQTDTFAQTLLYEEIPAYYTFNKQNGTFLCRRRGIPVKGHPGIFREHVLGRVYTIHPNNHECYFLRMLLNVKKGPTSFENLKTVNGTLYPTYQATCLALGLLEDDKHWYETLTEASVSSGASKLRELFAIMLVFCNVSNPLELWEIFRENFIEDLVIDYTRRYPDIDINAHIQEMNNRALFLLQEIVVSLNGKTIDTFGLPTPQVTTLFNMDSEHFEQLNYDPTQLEALIQECEPKLNLEQRRVFKCIVECVETAGGGMFFLDAPGGTGKTFLIKLILAKIRKDKKIAIAVASSGIAATLLPGGKTAHSMFKIPIDADRMEHPTCNISKNSQRAKVLQDCVFIVWDECTMAHKVSIEAVDRCLQDLRNDSRPFGGATILFSGDFRQTLPIVTRGTRADEVAACIKRSLIWKHLQILHITENMRARTGSAKFSMILLDIGEGKIPQNDKMEIIIPSSLCQVVNQCSLLISEIYSDLNEICAKENSWFCERSILAPKNEQVNDINAKIIEKIPGPLFTYTSIDTMCNQEESVHYPVEFLNSITAPGLPAHKIYLKVGVPIILLRNLNPPKLCNGTRLRVVALQKNVLEAVIITGCAKGEKVFIPRIPIIPTIYPFQFQRLQFPINLCFSMTINKSQGQTFSKVGVHLSNSCFSHGQLYVACSRVSDSTKLFLFAPEHKTKNVVYLEALV